jgi:predicted ATP-dependent serine protease
LAQIRADELITQAPEHIAWLVSKRLVEGGVNLLVGEVAAGKTYLALDLALGVAARGVAWGSLPVPRGNVLYYCLDSPPMTMAHRLKGLCQKYAMEAPRGLIFDFERHDLADDAEIAALEGLIVEKHIRLVIFDVLARYLGGLNENTALSIGPLMSRMRELCSGSGVSILFVHHFNKLHHAKTRDGERIRGSSEILASMDAALGVTLNGEVRELRSIKNRMGVEAEVLGFRIVQPDGEEDAGWLDFDVQVEQKFKMPTLVEMGLENVNTMLKILSGHFYTRGAIEEMLAEEFGLPSKRTLDSVFAGLVTLEGMRVETHERVKYYGYFGEDGAPGGWEKEEETQAIAPLDDAKKERLKVVLRRVLEEVKAKRENQG